MSTDEIWIVFTTILVGISCSLVGTFMVLRRLSMLGDAISHSVLFGIVVAALLSGGRTPWAMFLGALLVGLLTAFLTNFLNVKANLQEDASIGVTFTWLFALGVILISLFAGSIDLDQDCVLFGELTFLPFNTVQFMGIDIGPQGFYMIATVLIFNILILTFGFQRFSMISFDPLLARTLGVRIGFWHYLLMASVSLTTVASFEAVGAILVVALLVIPPNTAFLFARSVREMVLLSSFFSVVAAIFGFLLARAVDSSISASVVIVAGVELIMAIAFTKFLSALRVQKVA